MTTNNPTPQPAGEGGAPRTKPWKKHMDERLLTANDVLGFLLAAEEADEEDMTSTGTQATVALLLEVAKDRRTAGTLYTHRASVPQEHERTRCLRCGHSCLDEVCCECGILMPKGAATPTDIAERARRAAEEIVPSCLSRTCFIKDCGYDECWGCGESVTKRKHVADIIAVEFGGKTK